MRKKKAMWFGGRRFLAMAMLVVMVGSTVNVSLFHSKKVQADSRGIAEGLESNEPTDFSENFDNYESAGEIKGYAFGCPVFSIVPNGDGKALQVDERKNSYYSYEINVKQFAGKKISISADLSAYASDSDTANQFAATLKTTKAGEDDFYDAVALGTSVGPAFITITGEYQIPAGCNTYEIYFETNEDVSYIIDNINISVIGGYESEKPVYADISSYTVLKDLYWDYFKMGVVSGARSHQCKDSTLNEIGNPNKEALIKKEFNSLTLSNELMPAYNMGYSSPEATETYLPFVINPSAREMLEWANSNGIPVRGHALVSYSQCPDEVFCISYKPVYTDDSESELSSSCLVSRDVMLARLESYIDNVMKYMYENLFGEIIYCWDVVTEAIEPGSNQYNLRNNYWYQTIGADYIYYAFKYAREYSQKYAKEYAGLYGVDAEEEYDVMNIQPKLFYSDYNTFLNDRKKAIINVLTTQINGHSVAGEKYIDGIGMQAHLSDSTNLDTFIKALRDYSEDFFNIHITELDVEQTSAGVNADYYQAVFYKKLFEKLISEVDNGVNITCVTLGGLTDDNSWKKASSPLLFRADLAKKPAFDGVVYAKTGNSFPEPTYVAPDFSDGIYDFDAEGVTAEAEGFSPRGDSKLIIQQDDAFLSNGAVLVTGRTAAWHGACFDVSRFAGQTISISAWVKSEDSTVSLAADIYDEYPKIAEADTSSGEWVQIIGTYRLPSEITSLKLFFATDSTSDILIDNLKVKLVGMVEDFEGKTNIAMSRGMGQVPHIEVTGAESLSGSKSLLVTRSTQDANVKFDVSKYIGKTVTVKAHVKTTDYAIRLGFDGNNPLLLANVTANEGAFTEVSATYTIPNTLHSAGIYIETNGNADFYVDDFEVVLSDYTDDAEGEELKFKTRWGGAGTLERVEDENGNHAARLTDKSVEYYGICFDVTQYLGMQVEITCDVKTDDEVIRIIGDIDDVWPTYLETKANPGTYKTISTTVKLPKNLTALNLCIESNGCSDIYVDNLTVKRVPIKKEYKVSFDTDGKAVAPSVQLVLEGYPVKQPDDAGMNYDDYTFIGWYKDKTCKEIWNFINDKVTADTTLYAGWKNNSLNEYPIPAPGEDPIQTPSHQEPVVIAKPNEPTTETDEITSTDKTATENEETTNPDDTATETIANPDGTTTKKSVETKPDGTVIVTEKTETTEGKTIVTTTTSANGKYITMVTVKYDEVGTATQAAVKIDKVVKTNKMVISTSDVKKLVSSTGVADKNTTVTLTAKDKKGNIKYSVDITPKNLGKSKLVVYALDEKGNVVLVDQAKNTAEVGKDATLTLNISDRGDFRLLNSSEAKKAEKAILKTVKSAKKEVTVAVGKKTKFKLSSDCNKKNIESIIYSSDNKNVKVDKKGNITAVKAGTSTVTATVTLKNGSKKSIPMKITVVL